MTQEIEDLRQQLQDRDIDFKKFREEATGTSKRNQLRRAITIESDSIDAKRQAALAEQESDLLRDGLRQLELEKQNLMAENLRLQALDHTNGQALDHSNNLTSLAQEGGQSSTGAGMSLVAPLLSNKQQEIYTELEDENTRLATELSYYRTSRPDIGKCLTSA